METGLLKGKEMNLLICDKDDLAAAFRDVVRSLLDGMNEKKDSHVSVAAAAAALGVDRTTLWRWNREGYLKSHHIGKHVFYLQSDIDALIDPKQ